MTIDVVRIATRKSPLAMWQAEHIKARLEQLYPNLNVELVPMTSRGDKLLDAPLAKVGGKGLFVKELEEAIFENRADIAVHSMKDVPMEFPQGLGLAVICEREDPTDAFVSNDYDSLDDLPQGACVGTSSLRRQVQIQARRPDLKIRFLRGNVQTRLSKLDRGDFDAIVLATSGLKRVELAHRIKQVLPPEVCLPAVGQGALGIETRSDDQAMQELLAPLNHHETWLRVSAERALNRRLEGGCQVPIGSYAVLENDGAQLYLRGLVGDPEGDTVLTSERRGPAGEAQALGIAVAEDLLDQGAGEILRRVYETQ